MHNAYLSLVMMNTLRIYFITIVMLSGLSAATGQTVFQPKPIDYNLKGVVYDFETVFEGRLHAQGFTLGIKKGKLKSYYRTTYKNFEIGYIKDPRERRLNRNNSITGERISSAFVFGKAHEFFTLRYSYGEKRYLSEKTKRRGLAMGLIYEGGVTLGLLKPYAVNVIRLDPDDPSDQSLEVITYSEEVEEDFLNDRFLYGGASFFDGLSSTTPTIGLHGKVGMHWALGAFDQKVKAFETGIMFDVFPRKIPILIEQEDLNNNFFFFKIYLAFQFGTRERLGEQ